MGANLGKHISYKKKERLTVIRSVSSGTILSIVLLSQISDGRII